MITFFQNIGSFFKRAYRWCKKNIALVLTALGGLVSLIVYILIRKSAADIEQAKLSTQIAQTKIKIADINNQINDLKVKKAVLIEKDSAAGEKVAVIDKKLEKLDKTLTDYKNSVKTMSADSRLAEFEKLGY